MTVNKSTRHKVLLLVWANLMFGFGPAAQGNEAIQPLDSIRTAAEEFALARARQPGLSDVRAEAAALDSRLRLQQCDQTLEAFATGGNSLARSTVGVRCAGSKPWTLYVPVTVSALAQAVFTSRPLLRGEAIAADSIELRRLPLERMPANYIGSSEGLNGMETTRALQSGVALTLHALRSRQLVRQGQEVIIVASGQGVNVRMAGTALRGGAEGELIPVRNSSSGRTVEAIILTDKSVQVRL